jgi:Carboxypeptidase regulatory-like domain
VKGRALDTKGQPIANAIIWVNPVVTTGLYETWTDANGNYQATGLPPVGYRVEGWFEKEYRGKIFCLRLGYANASDYSPINPAEGVTRNLVWQIQGRMHDVELYEDMGYFGGSVAVMNEMSVPARNAPLEFTFTPIEPLIDGSTGQTLVRKPDAKGYLLDIPVGVYKVTATQNGQNVRLGTNASSLASEVTLEFNPVQGGCKGSRASGVERAYLYYGEGGGYSSTENPLNTDTSYTDGDILPDGYSDDTLNSDGTIVPATTNTDGMAGRWEGTLTYGSNTFWVQYVFTDSYYGDGYVEITGVLLECDEMMCAEIGTVVGKRVVDAGVDFTTTLNESGATFMTVGHFKGTTFMGLTDAVFEGQEAYVTLNPTSSGESY